MTVLYYISTNIIADPEVPSIETAVQELSSLEPSTAREDGGKITLDHSHDSEESKADDFTSQFDLSTSVGAFTPDFDSTATVTAADEQIVSSQPPVPSMSLCHIT